MMNKDLAFIHVILLIYEEVHISIYLIYIVCGVRGGISYLQMYLFILEICGLSQISDSIFFTVYRGYYVAYVLNLSFAHCLQCSINLYELENKKVYAT